MRNNRPSSAQDGYERELYREARSEVERAREYYRGDRRAIARAIEEVEEELERRIQDHRLETGEQYYEK